MMLSNFEEENQALIDEINKQNKFTVFFTGYNGEKLDQIKNNQIESREEIQQLQKILGQTDSEELKETLRESFDRFSAVNQKENLFLDQKEEAFSLNKMWQDIWGFFF